MPPSHQSLFVNEKQYAVIPPHNSRAYDNARMQKHQKYVREPRPIINDPGVSAHANHEEDV